MFVTAENVTIDNYEPILKLGNTLYTQAAVFDVTGDIDMGDSDSDRRRHTTVGGPFYNFFGTGGSMSFSPSGNDAFSGASGSGHPSSHGPCSAFSAPMNGFSQSSDVMFGENHNHDERHYMFSTHNDYHHSPGTSLHYENNMLNMHVHYPSPFGNHDNHYHVTVPFWPTAGEAYNFGASFR